LITIQLGAHYRLRDALEAALERFTQTPLNF